MTGRKALIVDDSKLAQFVLKKMLIDQNLLVDASPSAEDALKYLEKNQPDVIFLDHTMPGMNGLEVLKVIKKNPQTASIPVMMYTSQEDSNYMAQARDMGALEVLPKQLQAAELAKALARIDLGEKRAQETSQAAKTNDTADLTQNLEQNKEELEKLVYNAEIALGHEAAQQKLQQKLEQQNATFEKQLSALNAKIDAILPTAEQSRQRHSLWTNILWGALYCCTVAVFAGLYIQQKNAVELLNSNQTELAARSSANTDTNNVLLTSPINTPPATPTESAADATQTNTNEIASAPSNTTQLSALESIANSNNQIPYDELLLGDTVQTTLSELIPSLQQMNFDGRVSVVAHDGSFCVNNDDSGQLTLADDDTPITQCQITEASARLADIASIGLLQLITASNQSAESNFVITINPVGTNSPLEAYPAIEDTVLAGTWNDVALKNRRVDIRLFEE